MKTIDFQILHDSFTCDAEAGVLIWKVNRGRGLAGCVAGHRDPVGYVKLTVQNVQMPAHRIIWAMHYGAWPDQRIDHINGNPSDNRIANLRLATAGQNSMNCKKPRHNKSGYKGVHFRPHAGKFIAQIKVNKKQLHLGQFFTAEEAHKAYKAASAQYHGEFGNAG